MIATAENHPGPRFALRKRSIRNNRDMVNLSSYNSDFLSGLFADVAKANVLTDDETSCKRGSECITPDPSLQVSVSSNLSSNKKSRTSLRRTLSRVPNSCKNLATQSHAFLNSPKGINEFFGSTKTKTPAPSSLASSHKHESLAFQLNCVAGATDVSRPSTSRLAIGDAAKIAFPNLPVTVSDSSCSAGLTRANLVRKVSTPENEPKDCFGWFVDLEEDNQMSTEAPTGLPYAVSCDDLAFQAPTAPNGVNNDAEVEWAKAADTVDDVLGDFF